MPKNPKSRGLRACLKCRIVLDAEAFDEGRGCPNRCNTDSSPVFFGMMAVVQPAGSWVARWQGGAPGGGADLAQGVYALKVVGSK